MRKPCIKCRDMVCKDKEADFCSAYIKWIRITAGQRYKQLSKCDKHMPVDA
jgi:hypothetical protein